MSDPYNSGPKRGGLQPGDVVEFDHTHPGFEIHAGVVVHFGHGTFTPTFTGGVGIARPPNREDACPHGNVEAECKGCAG